jgi:hypothetical protein
MEKTTLYELAQFIENNVKQDFVIKFLSGNLRDTTFIRANQKGYSVHIPAKMYHIGTWKKTGAISYISGSYASKVATSGGFSKTHKDYDINAIEMAIHTWASKHNLNIVIKGL